MNHCILTAVTGVALAWPARAAAQQCPPPPGLIHHWSGNPGFEDVVGSAHGIPQGDAFQIRGIRDMAFRFLGEDEWVELGDAGNFGTRSFSISLWVNFQDLSGAQVLLEKFVSNGASSVGYTLLKTADHGLQWSAAPGVVLTVGAPGFDVGSWHHVAATHSGGNYVLYLDGVARATETRAGAVDTSSPSTLKLAHRGTAQDTPGSTAQDGLYLDAVLDEIELFDRALSPDEVLNQYEALRIPPAQELTSWTAESYTETMPNWPPGEWQVLGDGTRVEQVSNSQPTMFVSDFSTLGKEIEVNVGVFNDDDDDLFGIALGFQPGDSTNEDAEYHLIDWGGGDNFANWFPECGRTNDPAPVGLTLSRVFGIPSADEFWSHVNVDAPCTDLDSGVEELATGATLGGIPWRVDEERRFRIVHTPDRLQVYLDGSLEFDLVGDFPDGRLALYGLSQPRTRYRRILVRDADCAGTVEHPPTCAPGGPYQLDCQGPTSAIVLDGLASVDEDGDPLSYHWTTGRPNAVFDDPWSPFPTLVVQRGQAFETFTVGLTVSDGLNSSTCEIPIVLGDQSAPLLDLTRPDVPLWPPDGVMAPLSLTASLDDCDAAIEDLVVEMWSDEDARSMGSQRLLWPDAMLIDGCVSVRRERDLDGDGRVYLAVARLTDAAGNTTTAYCTAVVPSEDTPDAVASVQAQAAQILALLGQDPGTTPAELGLLPIPFDGKSRPFGGGSPQGACVPIVYSTNRAPVFVSLPPTGVQVGQEYRYDALAVDPEGRPVAYRLASAPPGMKILAKTGRVRWIGSGPPRTVHVVVEAIDADSSVTVHAFDVAVFDPNARPVARAGRDLQRLVGEVAVLDGSRSSDANGDPLQYSWRLVSAPEASLAPEALPDTARPELLIDRVGSYLYKLIVSDGTLDSEADLVEIRALNSAPVITSVPIAQAYVGLPYVYDVEAGDIDLQPLDYSLATAPAGMTIDALSGVVEWLPTELDEGAHPVSIVVSDPALVTATQDFVLTVEVNLPPRIVSLPRTTAVVDRPYAYDVDAIDPEAGASSHALDLAPVGMSIDAATGLVSWTPVAGQEGLHPVVVRASDAAGFSDLQEFDVHVAVLPVIEDIEPPVVVVSANPAVVDVGTQVTLTVVAQDDGGPAAVELDLDGAPLALDASGQAVFTPASPGGKLVTATATDGAGNVGSARTAVLVLDASDITPPVVSIDVPVPDAVVEEPVEIVGTVHDADLVAYRIEIRRTAVDTSFQVVAEGHAPVVNGVLGTLDPTLLEGGFHDVLLTAVDAGGNQVTTQLQVELVDALVLGAFTLPEVDLRLPVSGIPMEVVRVYDSRVKESRDFGVGWTLQLNSVQFSQTRPPGESWAAVDVGSFLPEWEYQSNLPHVISFHLGAGRAERFLFTPIVDDPTFDPTFGTALFVPLPGTTSSLEVVDAANLIWDGSDLLDDADIEVYDPERYRLHLENGNVVLYDRFAGVQEITEPNGNRMTIGPNGLAHSLGYSTSFTRDGQGRITSVTDPVGNAFTYDYDAAGDLVQVTDPVGGVTAYEYDLLHRLKRIVRPDGTSLQVKYDADGRWIGFVDPNGSLAQFDHDVLNRRTTITDQLGEDTAFQFDARGNITAETDALGRTTFRTYTADGLLDVETDRRGYTVDFDYDLRGNVTRYTDGENVSVSMGYDAGGRLTSFLDPLGNTVANTYDAAGNPTTFTDGSGLADLFQTNDAAGRPMQVSALGEDVSVVYDAQGRMAHADYSGFMPMEFEYDANGNLTRESTVVTTDSGPVTLERSFTYDGLNRLRTATDFEGHLTELTYEAGGQIHTVTDALGGVTTYLYDAAKNVVGVRRPDASEVSFRYDLAGRLLTSTDELQRTTAYEYDALGRRTRIVRPDGTDVRFEHDEEGNLTRLTDGGGRMVEFEYDGRELLTAVVDGHGSRTEIAHDLNRNIERVVDPRGRITEQRYRYVGMQVGLPERTIHPDLTETSHTYVDSVVPAERVAEDGRALRFTYDANRKVESVEDPLGNTASFDYDERGNLIRFTDARNEATTYGYDAGGRRTRRTSPGGATETWSYDATGLLEAHTDAAGRTTFLERDPLGRIVERTVGGVVTSFAYGPTGALEAVAHPGGTSFFGHDDLDRLVAAVNADGSALTYDHDGSGNVLSLENAGRRREFAYDEVSRLKTLTDPDGGTTTYAYDEAGVLVGATLPSGVTVAWERDLRDRVTSIEVRSADASLLWSVAYTLDAVGRRRGAVESSGRSVSWDYDAAGRLVQERVDDGSGVTTTTFGYDAVGNRIAKDVDGALTTYAYDGGNRLESSSDGSIYSYDANGNLVEKASPGGNRTYAYDAMNRLVAFTDEAGVTTTYAYDWDGLLVLKETAGAVTRFEWDRLDRSGVPQLIRIVKDGVATELVRGVGWNYLKGPAGMRFLHADGLGSVRAMTDASGALVSTSDYAAYGTLESISGPDPFPIGFAGEYRDPASGLTFLRTRWYDPELGRFLTQDGFEPHRTNPLALHRYLYANADPVNHTDPTGEFTLINLSVSVSISGILASIASGVAAYYSLDLDEIEEELDTFFDEIPGLKLDKAVDKSYEVLNDMTGDSKFIDDLVDEAVNNEDLAEKAKEFLREAVFGHEVASLGVVGLWHWNAITWLGYLPEKGDYFECEFNEYVAKLYLLEIVNKHGGKFTPTFKVLGYYLSYVTYLELMSVTLDALSMGLIPEQPPQELAEDYQCFFEQVEILRRED